MMPAFSLTLPASIRCTDWLASTFKGSKKRMKIENKGLTRYGAMPYSLRV